MDVNDFYKHGSSLDMPKRPYWDYTMTKEQVLANEERAFREYLQKVWSCGCMSWWGFLVALWLVVAWFLVPLVSLHPSCAFFFSSSSLDSTADQRRVWGSRAVVL